MTIYTWETGADGRTRVTGPKGASVPVLSDGEALALRIRVLDPWGPLIVRESVRTGVPVYVLAANVKIESNGNPGALGDDGKVVPGATTAGLGLNQITFGGFKRDPFDPAWPQSRKLSDAEVMEPSTNMAIAANILRDIMKVNRDVPSIASVYNAGAGPGGKPKLRPELPWGIAEHVPRDRQGNPMPMATRHIETFVRAANSAIALGWHLGATAGSSLGLVAVAALLAWWGLS